MNLIEDQTFKDIDFTTERLEIAEYEMCAFLGCNFSSSDLSRMKFSECTFENCDLSMANVSDTAFKDVQFAECKLLGLHFDYCNPFLFEIHCDNCLLNLASFYKVNVKRSSFKSCSLQEVDFSAADLSKLKFQDCDLVKAIFDNTNIEYVDFKTAKNFSIDLRKNKIKKAKFSKDGISGLLDSFDIEIS